MSNSSKENFEEVINTYNAMQKKEKSGTLLKLSIAFLILAAFSCIFLFLAIYVDDAIMAGFYLSLILPGGALLAIILILLFHLSSKPLFGYLYDLAIKEINEEDGLALRITPLPKEKDFIRDGGLFPFGTTRLTRYIIEFIDSYGIEVQIRDIYVATQGNRSAYVHIDGLYYILKVGTSLVFQLRTNGSPHFKRGTITKINTREDITEYSENAQTIPNKYYNIMDKLSIEGMKVNISGIDGELHVALHGYFNYRKIRNLERIQYDGLKEYLRRLIRIAEKINEIIAME